MALRAASAIPAWFGQAAITVMVTVLAVGAVAWMATAPGLDGDTPAPAASASAAPASAAAAPAAGPPATAYLLVVVSSDGTAAEFRGILRTEATLRALAGEPRRPAGVVVVRDEREFETLMAATDDGGAFTTQLPIRLLDLRRAD